MNMNKILAAGLIAAVASTASMADAGSHGFYVGANIGMDFTKMKVAYDEITQTMSGTDSGNADFRVVHSHKEKSIKKSKPMFRAELALGFDRAYECMVLGIDLTAGSSFGKSKKLFPGYQLVTAGSNSSGKQMDLGHVGGINSHSSPDDKDTVRVKTKWHVALMPRVGFMVAPKIELYATVGIKVAGYKLQYADENVTTGGEKESTTTKNSTKFSPVIGAGLRYEFNPHLLRMPSDMSRASTVTSLTKGTDSYYYPDIPANGEGNAKYSGGNAKYTKMHAHVIKLGIGYRF